MGKTVVLMALMANARGEKGVALLIVPTKVLVEQQHSQRGPGKVSRQEKNAKEREVVVKRTFSRLGMNLLSENMVSTTFKTSIKQFPYRAVFHDALISSILWAFRNSADSFKNFCFWACKMQNIAVLYQLTGPDIHNYSTFFPTPCVNGMEQANFP
ncbi:hypothetical protein R3P38DRAFT_2797949 [Favolaschia claudopus]|uniref:Uncharacterized protein n=1 Tax=Favolaschia claudopus TaxID=2862362 RepID=A0AAW0A2H2_9AGAR